MADRIVRYIDKGAVAAAMAEQHQQRHDKWRNALGWAVLISMTVAFWWWALFC